MKLYYWLNPTNNRYYLVTRRKDLFDDIVVSHYIGGTKIRKGRKILTMPLATRTDMANHLKLVNKIRKKHGYNKIHLIDYNRHLKDYP